MVKGLGAGEFDIFLWRFAVPILVLWLAMVGGIGYVAWHFVSKYW